MWRGDESGEIILIPRFQVGATKWILLPFSKTGKENGLETEAIHQWDEEGMRREDSKSERKQRQSRSGCRVQRGVCGFWIWVVCMFVSAATAAAVWLLTI